MRTFFTLVALAALALPGASQASGKRSQTKPPAKPQAAAKAQLDLNRDGKIDAAERARGDKLNPRTQGVKGAKGGASNMGSAARRAILEKRGQMKGKSSKGRV